MNATANSPSLRSITPEMLARYVELEDMRKPLARQVALYDKEQELIEKQIKAALAAEGRTEVSRGDFAAELRDGPAYVAWKEHFLRVAGIEAAADVQKQASPSKRLTVRKL